MKVTPLTEEPSKADRLQRLSTLLHDYNSVGLTSIGDRDTAPSAIGLYTDLRDRGDLPVRVSISHGIPSIGPIEAIEKKIRAVAEHPLFQQKDGLVRIIGIKTYLDGGMLTGSAYLREPWGVSKIYAITDPAYRGVLFIPKERLLPMVRTAIQSGLAPSSHRPFRRRRRPCRICPRCLRRSKP